MSDSARDFYEHAYSDGDYISPQDPQEHSAHNRLIQFIEKYELGESYCLEIGSGRGAFQDMVRKYVGMDVAVSAAKFVRKPFVAASATELPFSSCSFEGVWSIWVFEHVPMPELGLTEIWRVLKPGGFIYFEPAWHCRSWAAEGYPVRPYTDFNLRGKIIKASIPARNTFIFRSLTMIPMRIVASLRYLFRRRPMGLNYHKLKPNYEHFWMSDSDAINSFDPFLVYQWFVSRGAICLNYPTYIQAFLTKSGPLIFQKPECGDSKGSQWN